MARNTNVKKHERSTLSGRTSVQRHLRRIGAELISLQQLEKNDPIVTYKDSNYTANVLGNTILYKCKDCIFYSSARRQCTRVEGSIKAEGGCNLWVGVRAKKVN